MSVQIIHILNINLCCNKSSTDGTCWFNLCWTSNSSSNRLSISLISKTPGIEDIFLFWVVVGPKPKKPPPTHPSSLLLFLLFLLSNLFMPRNLSRCFCISNSLPGWLGRDLINSLSVCFFFKSISLSNEPEFGLFASNVEIS